MTSSASRRSGSGPRRFRSTLFRVPGKGGWVFAPIPARYAPPATHAWGRTPVRATVDGQSWNTSIWRAKDGRSLLAVPKRVRGDKDDGDSVMIELSLNWV